VRCFSCGAIVTLAGSWIGTVPTTPATRSRSIQTYFGPLDDLLARLVFNRDHGRETLSHQLGLECEREGFPLDAFHPLFFVAALWIGQLHEFQDEVVVDEFGSLVQTHELCDPGMGVALEAERSCGGTVVTVVHVAASLLNQSDSFPLAGPHEGSRRSDGTQLQLRREVVGDLQQATHDDFVSR